MPYSSIHLLCVRMKRRHFYALLRADLIVTLLASFVAFRCVVVARKRCLVPRASLETKKLGFKTPYQARQAVIHGHIMIGERKVDIPSYTVPVTEEDSIHFALESKIPAMLEK